MPQLPNLIEQHGLAGALALAVAVVVWRWVRKNVELDYEPEVIGSDDVRMRFTFRIRLPNKRR